MTARRDEVVASRRARVAGIGAVSIAAIVVFVLAAYATAGWIRRRHEDSGTGGELLFTAAFGRDPLGALLVFAAWAALYTSALLGMWWLARRISTTPPRRVRRPALVIAWLYGRWWRLAGLLGVLWLPLFALRWPGAINPDFALMVTEIAMTRPEFGPGQMPPYDIYPIAHALIPDGELVWSNQHGAFLTLTYGVVMAVSGVVFHSYLPGVLLLATSQALFTLFALGRALELVARLVRAPWARGAALAVTAGAVMIPLWSMDLSKTPLFAAAFVWWLALLAERVLAAGSRRLWTGEVAVATTVLIVSAKFGGYVALAGAAALLLHRVGWRRVVTGMVAPVLVLQAALHGLMAAGLVIPDDPVEGRAVPLQQIALTLREDPGALSAADRAALERLFDTAAMARVYEAGTADPVKSSGLFADKPSYRWRTLRPDDWDGFTGVWLRLGAARPDLYVDAFLLKSDGYLDPLARVAIAPPTRTWDWTVSYSLDLAPVNAGGRTLLVDGIRAVEATPVRHLLAPPAWAVATVLLCTTAVLLRRRGALAWCLPVALQVGVALLAPLNGSGRYLLGVYYVTGLALLILAARGERRTPPAAPGSAVTSERMDQ